VSGKGNCGFVATGNAEIALATRRPESTITGNIMASGDLRWRAEMGEKGSDRVHYVVT